MIAHVLEWNMVMGFENHKNYFFFFTVFEKDVRYCEKIGFSAGIQKYNCSIKAP